MVCILRRQVPSSLEALMIMDKTIVMDAQADPKLLKAKGNAHHNGHYQHGQGWLQLRQEG